MTEAEWLACGDAGRMMDWMMDRASGRKLRLFACACSRGMRGPLNNPCTRAEVGVAERLADGDDSPPEPVILDGVAYAYEDRPRASCAVALTSPEIPLIAVGMTGAVKLVPNMVGIVRDLFGNPFRPLLLDPVFLTETVTGLARTAYGERLEPSFELDPARLAVLSDALEEAGCDDADVLNHLRSPGPHYRGCHVMDALLGKE